MKVLNAQKNPDINTSIFLCIFWVSAIKRLMKKYIGKHLRHPFSFDITIKKEE